MLSLPPIRSDFILNWDKNSVLFQGREHRFPLIEFDIFAALLEELQFIPLSALKIRVLGKKESQQVEDKIFITHVKDLRSRLASGNLPVEILFPRREKCLLLIKGI